MCVCVCVYEGISVWYYHLTIIWQNGEVEESERDVYEVILTQSEIQDSLNEVNVAVAKEIAEAKCELVYMF